MKSILDQLLDELLQTTGLDLTVYRRSTLERRFAARMVNMDLQDLGEYLEVFRNHPTECHRLIDALVVKFSSFFRDPIVFEIITQSILPELIQKGTVDRDQLLEAVRRMVAKRRLTALG